jgi:hypothetical protein
MTDTLDDAWFDGLLHDVEATAPDDVRAAVLQMVNSDHRPSVSVDLDQPRPRRIPVAAAVAAAFAVSVAGLVVFLGRGDNPSTLTSVNSPATEASPTINTPDTSAVPSTIAAQVPTSMLAPSTVAAVPDPPIPSSDGVLATLGLTPGTTLSGDDALAALVMLDEYRVGLLRESSGFRGTSTSGGTWVLADGTEPRPDAPPIVVDVTVLANGDVWAAYPNGDWFRFDAVAGISRSLSTNPFDGTLSAIQTVEHPVQHNYGSASGHNPLGALVGLHDSLRRFDDWNLQLSASEFEGGDAVEVLFDSQRIGPINQVVDLRTGLIVKSETTDVEEEGTLGSYSSITGLTDAETLPVAAVPQLPDGLEWQERESFPNVLSVTIEEAQAAFGSGLRLPQTALDAGFVSMELTAVTSDSRVVAADDPEGEVRQVTIYYFEPDGLLRTEVELFTERPGRDGTIPDGYVQVGDRICSEPCLPTAPGFSTLTPENGALAGVTFFGPGPGIATYVDGIYISIAGPTRNEATATAETFVTVAENE